MLGAGLQGTTVAFALAEAGFTVTVVDEAGGCLERASIRNEGKIHLGFVYAHDTTRRTASVMLESALAFGPLLEHWLGAALQWRDAATGPFSYLILTDSLVESGKLLEAWEGLQATYEQRRRSASYLGERPSRLWAVPTGAARQPFTDRVSLVVDTVERAVDPQYLKRLVHARLEADGRICSRYGHRVRTVRRTLNGFKIEATDSSGKRWTAESSVVVNCLWAGRLAIDREMGVLPRRPWVYRLKYRLLGRLPDQLRNLPSVTMMLGPFGDVVNLGEGRVYLSWYPTCLGGWSSDVEPPESWIVPCRDGVSTSEAGDLVERTLEAFDRIVPGLGDCRIDSVAAGVIFSWGATDIDDLGSELHRRHDIGPEFHDGYVTVNTGKLTSAPMFARQVADLVG